MKTTLHHILASLITAGALALGNSAVRAQATGHLAEGLLLSTQIADQAAQGIFTDAANIPLNQYGGSWSASAGKPKSGYSLAKPGSPARNLTTCAPLISRLLQNVYGWKWSNYSFFDPVTSTVVTTASPYPYQMVALLNAGKGFTGSTTDLDQAVAGDVLLFWRPSQPTDDHAALFIEARWDDAVSYPTGLPASVPALAGSRLVPVEILDSTGDTLHSEDSRLIERPAGTFTVTHGIGTGVIGILVAADGQILGHTWSLPTNGDPSSADADVRNAWVINLNSRLETQTGAGARSIVFGHLAL